MAESLPAEWARQVTSDGRTYYYHKRTRETRWSLPAEVQAQADPDPADPEPATAEERRAVRPEVKEVVAGIYERLRLRQARLVAAQEADAALNPPAFDEEAVAPSPGRQYEKPWLAKRVPTPQTRPPRRRAGGPASVLEAAPGMERYLQRAEQNRRKFEATLEDRPDVGGHGLCKAGEFSARAGWNFSTQLPRERPPERSAVLAREDKHSHQPAPRTLPPKENLSQEAIYALAGDVQQALARDQRSRRAGNNSGGGGSAAASSRRSSFFGLYNKQGQQNRKSVRASRREYGGHAPPPPTAPVANYDPEIPAAVEQIVSRALREEEQKAKVAARRVGRGGRGGRGAGGGRGGRGSPSKARRA